MESDKTTGPKAAPKADPAAGPTAVPATDPATGPAADRRDGEGAVTDAAGSSSAVADSPREINGPKGPEPTRYGDWEQKGRCSDF